MSALPTPAGLAAAKQRRAVERVLQLTGDRMAGIIGARAPAPSGAVHRTGIPVLRGSLEEGTFEEEFFVVPAPGETNKMVATMKRAVDEARRLKRIKREGKRSLSAVERKIVRVTPAVLRVFEELCDFARRCSGKVYPSYEKLMDETGYVRSTIAYALGVLENLEAIVRQRRFKRVPGEGPGPRFEQTSNAYRVHLPKMLVTILPRWMRPAPTPDDELQRQTDRVDDCHHMLGQLNCQDFARAVISRGSLQDVLAKLGAAIDESEREFENAT